MKGPFLMFGCLTTLNSRLSKDWHDAAACAVAACMSWMLAAWLLGHPHPVFAVVTAIVCLAPGLPSHGRQAVGLMLGVATGILVGEVAIIVLPEGLLVPEGLSLLRLGLATFLSILIAAAFGQAAVVAIQSGVSAVLVLAFGPHSAGLARLEDVAVGVGVGLLFSQVLLTPDPVRQIDAAADDLLRRLEDAFEACADALEKNDAHRAAVALKRFSSAHESLIALSAGIDAARFQARWSLRGRFAARAVTDIASRYDRGAIRLYASSLLFGEAFADAMHTQAAPVPEGFAAAIRNTSIRCARLASNQPSDLQIPEVRDIGSGWLMTIEHWRAAFDVLNSLEELHPKSLYK